jgi:superfamily II DNA or RNA helicase
MILREYQIQALQKITEGLETYKKILVQLPTGTGKTRIFSEFIKNNQDKKFLVIAHTQEIIEQIYNSIQQISEIKPNLYSGKSKVDNQSNIDIYTIQTVYKLDIDNYDYLIIDESHHSVASTYILLINNFFNKNKNGKLIGFTATVKRTDGVALKNVFEKIVFYKPIKYFIDNNFLVKPRSIEIKVDIDLSKAKISRATDDFLFNSELRSALNSSNWKFALLNAWLDNAKGKQTIAFCASVEHSQELCQAFQNTGFIAAHIDATTNFEDRNRILQDFKNKKIQVITNHAILTEGFDSPAIECVMMCRPTKSQLFYIQAIGRGLRKFDKKQECIILDFSCKNHNLVNFADMTGDALIEKIEKNSKQLLDDHYSSFSQNLLLSLKERQALLEFEYGDIYERIVNLLLEDRLDWGIFNDVAILNGVGRLVIVPRHFLLKTNLIKETEKHTGEYFVISGDEQKMNGITYYTSNFQYSGTQEQCIVYGSELALEYADNSCLKTARWKNDPISKEQFIRLYVTFNIKKEQISNYSRGDASKVINYLKFLKEINYVQ